MNIEHIGVKGEGYFCQVTKYLNKDTGKHIAFKTLKKKHYPKDDYRYRLNREIKILEDLQGCENIIELIGSGNDRDAENLYYIMPFADTNLYDYIKKNNSNLTTEDRFNLIQQVITAIKFAHDKNILHRDISPSNVLVFFDGEKIILKVSDFGLGKSTESLSYYTKSSDSGYGQILYVSPEQRNKLKDSTNKSDIYSLGKLVYFVFTGKDPDNLKQFELSSLVTKATEENSDERFENIHDFESHFHSLKELQLNETIDFDYLTLKDVLDFKSQIDWIHLHQVLVRGNYFAHVYQDYLEPATKLILNEKLFKEYHQNIGSAIKEFIKTYIERLDECYQTVGWPFSDLGVFGLALIKVVKDVQDDEVRLLCFKHLWYIAYEADKWSVQKEIKSILSDTYITKSIETQFAEYIISRETEVEMSHFAVQKIPLVIKRAIIKGAEIAKHKHSD